jgi:hypothetical protein
MLNDLKLTRFGTTTSWGIISHLVVNNPYSVPYLPTTWLSFFEKSALGENDELAHLHEYQGVFFDIVSIIQTILCTTAVSHERLDTFYIKKFTQSEAYPDMDIIADWLI